MTKPIPYISVTKPNPLTSTPVWSDPPHPYTSVSKPNPTPIHQYDQAKPKKLYTSMTTPNPHILHQYGLANPYIPTPVLPSQPPRPYTSMTKPNPPHPTPICYKNCYISEKSCLLLKHCVEPTTHHTHTIILCVVYVCVPRRTVRSSRSADGEGQGGGRS